jgi:hypothetical protein
LKVSYLFLSSMILLPTVALVTGLLVPYVSAALIPGGALQAAVAKPQSVQKRGVTASSLSGRLFDIEGKVQYFAGTNARWLDHLTGDVDLDTAMSEIAQAFTTLNIFSLQ